MTPWMARHRHRSDPLPHPVCEKHGTRPLTLRGRRLSKVASTQEWGAQGVGHRTREQLQTTRG